MKRLFLKLKPAAILLLLKDSQQSWYPSKLARSSGCSYVHAVNLLSRLRELGAVSLEKKGRQNFYKLSEKGAYLAMSLDDFSKRCDSFSQEARQAKAALEAQQKTDEKAPAQPAGQQAPQSEAKAAEKKEEKK